MSCAQVDMSDTQPAPSRAKSRRKCAVYLGSTTFVEIEDDPSTITLEELCEAFGTPWESGMHVKHRATGRVVATLPFEPMPTLEDVSDAFIKAESTTATTHTGDLTVPTAYDNAEEDVDGAEEGETMYAVVYDLVTPTAPGDNGDSELAAAVTAAGLLENLPADADGTCNIGETMRKLVELGAAELLTAEPLSVSQARREYNPPEAPGLLRRIVYPASQYSPYRLDRDPLHTDKLSFYRSSTVTASVPSGPPPTSCTGLHALPVWDYGEGGLYTSYFDSYDLSCPMRGPFVRPSAAGKAALVMPLSDEEHHRIFGA
ncbi:conserved hypothetical protein [Leishmania major strain Friedlin]|uniref:Uncharacterized protein n=1 Tax=Leishmania major TaxID=5664 RepID=Q4Q2Z5_LEIMA|nr:conserved hypothetical protein [Leishmania major strain Friedlin]CAG9582076.1 hypothetical_protein_-_conserved [Leishmania major strain Friedlin]CAJ07918.1 conserved hypothetical protein [Leishmania major strain Friedlin]|eukprot:XP_001686303.1 conserved hypothetical protein [Leishmania major strain Friedlin]